MNKAALINKITLLDTSIYRLHLILSPSSFKVKSLFKIKEAFFN